MSVTNVITTLNIFSFIPPKSICRGKEASGKLKIDYYVDSTQSINGLSVKEKLKEAKEDGTVTFTKAGETAKTSAELKKEGKPISVDDKVKVK